jgi:hypothetical protein
MEIVGELGKGNYGSVQQVYHRPSEINMAMKVSLGHLYRRMEPC